MATSWSGCDLAYSRTLRMFKVAERPGTKPDWAEWSKEGNNGARCKAIILHRILTSTLIRDIGQYEPGFRGSFPFLEVSLMCACILWGDRGYHPT